MRSLSAFAGGADLAGIEAVCESDERDADLLSDLAALAENSLVIRQDLLEGERFRLLETIREFGLEQLAALHEHDEAMERVSDHLLELAQEASHHLARPTRGPWLNRLEQEYANLRAVIAWALEKTRPELALGFVAGLPFFWHFHDEHLGEGAAFASRALDLLEVTSSDGPSAEALAGAAALAFYSGDFRAARARAERALKVAGSGDEPSIAIASLYLGTVHLYQGDPETAEALLLRSANSARRSRQSTLACLSTLLRGDALHGSDTARAEALYAESLELARGDNDEWAAAFPIVSLSRLALERGDIETALALAEEAVEIRRRVGHQFTLGISLAALGEVHRCREQFDAARSSFEESLELFRRSGSVSQTAWPLQGLGFVDLALGDVRAARTRFAESLEVALSTSQTAKVGVALLGLACAALESAETRPAARLLGLGNAVVSSTAEGFDVADARVYDRTLRQLEDDLGPEGFARAFEEGQQTLTPESVAATMRRP